MKFKSKVRWCPIKDAEAVTKFVSQALGSMNLTVKVIGNVEVLNIFFCVQPLSLCFYCGCRWTEETLVRSNAAISLRFRVSASA